MSREALVFRYHRPMAARTALLAVVCAGVALVGFALIRQFSTRSSPSSSAASTLAVAEIAGQVRGGRPVIFLGLDGADWNLLDDYMARGVMPTLARLASGGTTGRLRTIQPALSPLIWTTMMTGASPLDHGILDFVQFNRETGRKEPIGSTERRMPAVWNMANAAGRTAGVFGLWATYPAEAIDGLMVSDRLFTFLFTEQAPPDRVVFPEDKAAWAQQVLAGIEQRIDYQALKAYLPWLTEAEYERVAHSENPYATPTSALRRILVETAVYRDLSLEWIRRERPDLSIVYFQGTDSIGHVFAPYVAPRQVEVSIEDFDRYRGVPEQYFRAVDAVLGDYARLAEESGAVLMLASDHGFLWGEGRPTTVSSVAAATAARWHATDGMYLLHGPGIAAVPGHDASGSVEQVAATLLALLGLPPGRDVNGEPLPGTQPTGADRVDYFTYFRPSSVSPADPAKGRVNDDALANLRALGYVGGGESSEAPAGARGSTRSAGSYNNEGVIQRSRDRMPQAIEAFERAIALDPGLVSAQWNLSDVLYARGQQLDRADELLQRAFAGGLPDGNRYLIGRAIAYQRAGQTSRSLALIEGGLKAHPDDAELWLFRGRYRIEAGDCKGAGGDFVRATTLAPANPAAHASLGLARMCVGDRSGARLAFEQSLRLDPAQPKVRDFLAKVGR